jgi:hypothetical protein
LFPFGIDLKGPTDAVEVQRSGRGRGTAVPQERTDFMAASRALRALLRHYELATGRQLQTVLLSGRGV